MRFARMDHDRILRLSAVLWKTGLPKSGLYRLIKEGSFPKQVPLTPRSVGWRESEVERWIANPAGYGADRAATPNRTTSSPDVQTSSATSD